VILSDKMKKHIIPAGAFFTDSPEIHIRCHPAIEDAVTKAKDWIEQHDEKGGRMNCQIRPSSNDERDGHLIRLLGVKKMHHMLSEVQGQTDCWLMYHKKASSYSLQTPGRVNSELRIHCRRSHGLSMTVNIHATCLRSTTGGG
jgi:hypothetical protein